MTQLNVNKFQHTNGSDALIFATPRTEPTRVVFPNVASLPPVSETVQGETFFNTTDKRLYISTGTSYISRSSFSQPSGTFAYGWQSSISNGNTSPSPSNVWFRRNIFQTVYTVSDLTSNGAESGAIFRNLRWNITGAIPAGNSARGLNIRLFHTTQADGSATASPVAGQSKITVYADTSTTDTLQFESTGIKTFTFGTGNAGGTTSSFEWNGVNNICIESCTSQNESIYTQAGQQLIVNVTNGSRYVWTDATGNSCFDTPNTSVGYKSSVQMDFS
jgi:hypothetical protein